MATVAELGLKVDSSQVSRGTVELQKMSAASKGAETSARALSGAADQEAAALSRASSALTVNSAAARINGAAVAQAARMSSQMTRQLSYQLIDVAQAIPLAFQSPLYALQNVGFQVAQIGQLYMGQGGIRAALTDIASIVGRIAVRFAPVGLAIGAAAIAVHDFRDSINEATGATYSMADIAVASFQVIGSGIYSVIKPAVDAIAPWFSAAWEMVANGVSTAVNFIVGAWVGGFNAIKAAWSGLPAAIGDLTIQTANSVISGVEFMINRVVAMLNTIPGVDVGAGVSLGGIDNPYAGAAGALPGNVSGAFGAAMGTDYVGQFRSAVAAQAAANAAKKLGEATKGAGNEISALNDMFSDSMRAAQREFNFYQDTFSGFFLDLKDGLREGEGLWDAFGNAASNALDSILGRIIEMASNQIFGQLFGGLFGVAPGQAAAVPMPMPRPAGLHHTGGIAGAASQSRYVHPAYFDDAPRYHTGGIAGDEVPAILRRGEGVFTPAQMAAMGGGTEVNIINQGAAVESRRRRGGDGREIIDVLVAKTKEEFATGGFDQPMRRYPVRPKRF